MGQRPLSWMGGLIIIINNNDCVVVVVVGSSNYPNNAPGPYLFNNGKPLSISFAETFDVMRALHRHTHKHTKVNQTNRVHANTNKQTKPRKNAHALSMYLSGLACCCRLLKSRQTLHQRRAVRLSQHYKIYAKVTNKSLSVCPCAVCLVPTDLAHSERSCSARAHTSRLHLAGGALLLVCHDAWTNVCHHAHVSYVWMIACVRWACTRARAYSQKTIFVGR